MLVDNALAVGAAQDGLAGQCDAGSFLGRLGKNREELTGAQSDRLAFHCEMDGN